MSRRTLRAVLLLLPALFAPALSSPEAQAFDPQAFDPRCPVATEERAKGLAERAAAFLKSSGAEAALPAFTARTHGFGAGDLYVFVLDFHGTLLANGGWPELVGARIAGPDPIYDSIRRRAASPAGRGWVRYRWYSPCTRSMQPKMSYVIRVGDYIVGVGAYTIPSV